MSDDRVQRLQADRFRVLKALLAGGYIAKRRVFPYPETYHLMRIVPDKAASKVSESCLQELMDRRLIQPRTPIDINDPRSNDNVDYVATPSAVRAVEIGGIEWVDTQESLFGESEGTYEHPLLTEMD